MRGERTYTGCHICLASSQKVSKTQFRATFRAETSRLIGLRGEDGLLAPMLLWDATMAHAIAAALGTAPAARLIVHVCGRDHCLGISEMLRCHYCPAAVPLTVAFYPETDLQTFDAARHAGVGDFVVLTDEACNSDN